MSKNLYASRAAVLGGKVRDVTRTRDGFLVAAVITGEDTAATVAKIAGVDPSNVSRLVKMTRTFPAIESLVAAIVPGSAGDRAALALGTALAERKQANAAAEAANKVTARNAGGTTTTPAATGTPESITPAGAAAETATRSGKVVTTAPITAADVLRSLAATRDAVASITWSADEIESLSDALQAISLVAQVVAAE